jgi:hypothetical protein
MNQVDSKYPSFPRSGCAAAVMSSKPPRPIAAVDGGSDMGGLASPRSEAEIATFLLQLKHRSPYPGRGKIGDDSDNKESFHSYRHGSQRSSSFGAKNTNLSAFDPVPPHPSSFHRYGSSSSSFGPMSTTPSASNRSSSHVSLHSNLSGAGLLPWDTLLNHSYLVLLKDRDLVPDALFIAMAQMVPCRLTPSDRVGSYKVRTIASFAVVRPQRR